MSDLDQVRRACAGLFAELIDGPPANWAFVLNPGDRGLLRSLDTLSAAEAFATPAHGGGSVAAHVDHLCYGIGLLNRWRNGEEHPFADADYGASWQRGTVSDDEWAARRAALAHEASAWKTALLKPRVLSDVEMNGVISSVVHLAYHVGAIRQIARALRGPGASD